jgi:chromosome segregation ATPase
MTTPCNCPQALALAARLAEVEGERDRAAADFHNAVSMGRGLEARLTAERDAALAEVAALREDLSDARSQLEAQAEDGRTLLAEVAALRGERERPPAVSLERLQLEGWSFQHIRDVFTERDDYKRHLEACEVARVKLLAEVAALKGALSDLRYALELADGNIVHQRGCSSCAEGDYCAETLAAFEAVRRRSLPVQSHSPKEAP